MNWKQFFLLIKKEILSISANHVFEVFFDVLSVIANIVDWRKYRNWPILMRDSVHGISIISSYTIGLLLCAKGAIRYDFFTKTPPIVISCIIFGIACNWLCAHLVHVVIGSGFKMVFNKVFGDPEFFLTKHQKQRLQNTLLNKYSCQEEGVMVFGEQILAYCRARIANSHGDELETWQQAFYLFRQGNLDYFFYLLKINNKPTTEGAVEDDARKKKFINEELSIEVHDNAYEFFMPSFSASIVALQREHLIEQQITDLAATRKTNSNHALISSI